MKRERCIGTLHGPLGDCLRPVTGGLLCYGYIDRDEAVPLRESLEGPRPLLFPSCPVHRAPLVEWAEHLWGEIADGMWVPVGAFEVVKRRCQMEADPLVMSPDPSWAVQVVA